MPSKFDSPSVTYSGLSESLIDLPVPAVIQDFQRPDADAVFRASDGGEFRIHRAILAVASPFFESLFSLPQPANGRSDLPVIDIEEDSLTIETLLGICYPVLDPAIDTLGLARSVLEAAVKYDVRVAIHFCTRRIVDTFVKTQPLQVYAIACVLGSENIARVAAEEAIAQNVVADHYVVELEKMTAGCYHRLLRYQRDGAHQQSPFSLCRHARKESESERSSTQAESDGQLEHLFSDPGCDLTITTRDKAQFKVYKALVEMASPVLKSTLRNTRSAAGDAGDGRASAILTVDEDADTFHLLLQLCHPSCTPQITDIHSLPRALNAAKKYQMAKVEMALVQRWSEFTALDPLRSYLLAASYDCREQMMSAARALLSWTFRDLCETYTVDLEGASAGSYYRLLQYHKKCGEVASALAVPPLTWVPDDLKEVWMCPSCWSPSASPQFAAKWFVGYLERAAECLKTHPSASALSGGVIFVELLRVGSCSNCHGRAERILALNSAFSRCVEAAIAQVDPEMLWDNAH